MVSPPPRFVSPRRATWLAVVFLALSVLDLLLTWRLLQTPGECFYEANPLAGSILEWGGWWGLGLYKLACAATVLGVIALLARWRPRLARLLLTAACPLMALVVGYSLWLVSGEDRRELLAVYQRGDVVDQKVQDHRAYQGELTRLAGAVVERRLTLPQATRELSAYVASLRHNPLDSLRAMYQDLHGDEARLAAALVREANHLLRESGRGAGRSLAWLSEEFSSAYASPLPEGVGGNSPRTDGPAPRRPHNWHSDYPHRWLRQGQPAG